MKTIHYNNLFRIEDEKKCEKLMDFFNQSVKNDINKWKKVSSERKWNDKDNADIIHFRSAEYNDFGSMLNIVI